MHAWVGAHSCLMGVCMPQHARGKRKLEDDSEECWNYSSTVIVEVLYEEKIKFIFFEEIENTWMCGNMKL